MSFFRETSIKAIRKPRTCYGCSQVIEVGSPALDCAGHFDGDFWAATYHSECRAAEIALNHDVLDFLYGDDWHLLSEIEPDDWCWLLEAHPAAAARINITAPRIDSVMSQRRRFGSAA